MSKYHESIFLILCRIPIFVTWPYLTAANQLKLPALAILLYGILNVLLSIWYVCDRHLTINHFNCAICKSVWFQIFDEYERKLFIDLLKHLLQLKKPSSN